MNNVVIYTITLFGISFVFKAHGFEMFVFLFIFYGGLMLFDVATRLRITRKFKETNSQKGKEGLLSKVQIMLIMSLLASVIYFITGMYSISTDCNVLCVSVGIILNSLMGLFVLFEFSSIIENINEYNERTNREQNPVLMILNNIFGLLYNKISNKLDNQVNQILENDKDAK
jgi:hypothetical protein